MSDLQLIQATAKIMDLLQSHGITVEQHSNFKAFSKAHRMIGKSSVSGQFRLAKFELYDENAFWLKFTNSKKSVAVMASRFEHLGDRNLAEHWQDQHKRIYPKPNKIGKRHSKSTFKISGDVVYSGEFVLNDKFCGNGLAAHMVFLKFLLSYLRWRPKWVYGLMSNQLVMRGFAAQIGYTITEPRGTHWKVPPEGISCHDWLVAISAKDIEEKAKIIAEFGLEPFLLTQKT